MNARQYEIITELQSVYPIVETSPNTFTICNLVLPDSDYAKCDDEEIATALGYVCHLVFMIAKYLELPLRYPLKPMCSRSSVTNPISPQFRGKDLPLFKKGTREIFMFDYAVFLLNKDIQQLCNACGTKAQHLQRTLPNLRALLERFTTD